MNEVTKFKQLEKPILAFPTPVDYYDRQYGMTLRDYFAAKAMQEFCKEFDDDAHIAKVAYKIADAMLKERQA